MIEQYNNGEVNPASYDICTNHSSYLKKLAKFFVKNQREFDIRYWKLDGFAT